MTNKHPQQYGIGMLSREDVATFLRTLQELGT
jgi:hypothetical protein